MGGSNFFGDLFNNKVENLEISQVANRKDRIRIGIVVGYRTLMMAGITLGLFMMKEGKDLLFSIRSEQKNIRQEIIELKHSGEVYQLKTETKIQALSNHLDFVTKDLEETKTNYFNNPIFFPERGRIKSIQ